MPRTKKARTWQQRLHQENSPPSPLTQQDRNNLMNVDSIRSIEPSQGFRSFAIKGPDGRWR